jgi:hypothetical protein
MRTQLMIGRRCQIQAGRPELVGRVGTVIAREGAMYRIRLLVPVNVAGLGEVKDELWERHEFRLLPMKAANTRQRAKAES